MNIFQWSDGNFHDKFLRWVGWFKAIVIHEDWKSKLEIPKLESETDIRKHTQPGYVNS